MCVYAAASVITIVPIDVCSRFRRSRRVLAILQQRIVGPLDRHQRFGPRRRVQQMRFENEPTGLWPVFRGLVQPCAERWQDSKLWLLQYNYETRRGNLSAAFFFKYIFDFTDLSCPNM